MIERTDGLGHSLKASLNRPGVVSGEGLRGVIDADLMQRGGWRGGDLSGERGRGEESACVRQR